MLIIFALFIFPRSFQPVWFQDTLPFLGLSHSSKGDARVVRRGGGWADSQCDTGQSQPCDLVATVGDDLYRWFFGSMIQFDIIFVCGEWVAADDWLLFWSKNLSRWTPMLFHSLRKRAEDGLERVSPQHLSTQGPLGHVRWPCGRPVDWKLGSSEDFLDEHVEEFGQFVSSLIWCFKHYIYLPHVFYILADQACVCVFGRRWNKFLKNKDKFNERKVAINESKGPKEARQQVERYFWGHITSIAHQVP